LTRKKKLISCSKTIRSALSHEAKAYPLKAFFRCILNRFENFLQLSAWRGTSLVVTALLLAIPRNGLAAEFNGAQLGVAWSIPFVGILLSIALLPLLLPRFWHHHFGKVSAGWTLAFLVPFVIQYGFNAMVQQAAHTLLLEYIPFISYFSPFTP
jgi:hypothetical protein